MNKLIKSRKGQLQVGLLAGIFKILKSVFSLFTATRAGQIAAGIFATMIALFSKVLPDFFKSKTPAIASSSGIYVGIIIAFAVFLILLIRNR